MPRISENKIGRYEIEREIGRGGMAVVYRARDPRLDRIVAVKLIRKGAFPPDQLAAMMERFRREAKALARLNHPNIVKVMDYGEHEGAPYLVMEYIEGMTLKSVKKPLRVETAVRLIRPIAEALEYVHSQGLLHRDVKPSNIMITTDRRVILTDFGIAKWLEDDGAQTTLTGTGIGIGTPEYMAPEQGRGQRVDGRTDAYSLTIVFFELITGMKPYRGDTPVEILLKQARDPIPDPCEINPRLPKTIKRFFDRALAKKPADRYPTMEDYLHGLEGLRRLSSMTADEYVSNPRNRRAVSAKTERSSSLDPMNSRNFRGTTAPDRRKQTSRPSPESRRSRNLLAAAVFVFIVISVFILTQGRRPVSPTPTTTDHSAQVLGTGVSNDTTASPAESETRIAVSAESLDSTEKPLSAVHPYSGLKKGDLIRFGRYEQDNNLFNGPEPIEWTVLEVSDGTAFLLSLYGLDEKKFDNAQNDDYTDVTWENSDLRAWLNGDFFESAFNGSEKTFIQPVRITRNDQLKLIERTETNQDNYVFLLNWAELAYYVGLKVMDSPHATYYALANGANQDNNGFTDWWLRSTDFSRGYQIGGVCTIDRFKSTGADFSDRTCAVRPVIKLRMTDEIIIDTSGTSAESDLVIGDSVQLGSFEQDNNIANGAEPIEWQVLDVTEDDALLLSKYLLTRDVVDETCGPYTWKQSSLRNWLNGSFYQDVFSDQERSKIKPIHLDNWDKTLSGSKSDFETDDSVFLLSPSEYENFVKGDFRLGRLTPSLQAEYDFIGSEPSYWWLRTPGMISSGSSHVSSDGSVFDQCFSYCCDGFYFVRPAIRIRL